MAFGVALRAREPSLIAGRWRTVDRGVPTLIPETLIPEMVLGRLIAAGVRETRVGGSDPFANVVGVIMSWISAAVSAAKTPGIFIGRLLLVRSTVETAVERCFSCLIGWTNDHSPDSFVTTDSTGIIDIFR